MTTTMSTGDDADKPLEGRSSGAVGEVLFRLYGHAGGTLRKLIRRVVMRLEGGELYSLTLRRVFSTYHGVTVGLYSGGAAFVPYALPAGTTVGRYSTLTGTMKAFNANHPMNLKSTHAFFYNPRLGVTRKDCITRPPLTIGSDVFIGHNAIILPPVRSIGDGAVIGAGTVVQEDVPPYAVVVGHPGKKVRYRFPQDHRQQLLESRWWEKPIDELRAELDSFQQTLDGNPVR